MSTYLICALSIGGLGAAVWTLHTYYKQKYLRKLAQIKPPEIRYWVGYDKGSREMKEAFVKWHYYILPEPGVEVIGAFIVPDAPDTVMYYLTHLHEGEKHLGNPDWTCLGWAHFPRMTHREGMPVKDHRPMPPQCFIQPPLKR